MANIRTIIPCAGYGTRMKLKLNQSKEMIIDPITNKPLIEHFINITENPLIITRKEKTDLIEYCKEKNIQYIIIEPTNDWPDSVLKSKVFWNTKNILVLPDTNLSYDEYNRVYNFLNISELVFGIHKVNNISKWGQVTIDHTIEKPKDNSPGWAWGCIGFDILNGETLFSCYTKKIPYMYDPDYARYILLNNFKDRTRNGVLE